MIGLLQRVQSASVDVDGERIASIGPGLLVLVGIVREDGDAQASRLVDRLLSYRVFTDDEGRMNRSLREHRGGLLLVPQFTLAADTRRGTRASFTTAAEPARARSLFADVVSCARQHYPNVACGRFGADMKVALINDGPVTFWLEAK